MLTRLIGKTRQALREEGFLKTCVLGKRWIASRGKVLLYEPVRVLRPVEPAPGFERADGRARIAVQIHMYHMVLMDELIDATNQIPYRFDCFISTDTEEKAAQLREGFARRSHAQSVCVQCFPNRGRDIAPFLAQMTPVVEQYDYLLHLHSKFSAHDDFGNQWRHALLHSLLDYPGHVAAILAVMESDEPVGLVFQRTYWRVKPSLGWKGNREGSQALMERMGLHGELCRNPQFPAGDMFWAKTAAVLPMFQCGLTFEDFPPEGGQVDGTIAHCIERCWGCVANARGFRCLRVKARAHAADTQRRRTH